MRKRFKLPLTFLGLLITGCILLFAGYTLYYEITSDATVVVDSPLSINYMSPVIIDKTNNTDITFSVSNNGSEEVSYYIAFDGVESDILASFELFLNNQSFLSGEVKSEIVKNEIFIKPGETHSYSLDVFVIDASYFEAELIVKKVTEEKVTFGQKIINDNEIKDMPVTNVGKNVATTDEGLIKITENNQDIFYFRGSVHNNYVLFADTLWRIVKINEDGSVKLILNEDLESMSKYYESIDAIDFGNSEIKKALDSFYDINLSYYSDYIINEKYCNDNSLVDSNNLTYAAYNRAQIDYIATYTCIGEEINSKIALLTVDEAMFAGATSSEDNKSIYLINDTTDNDFYLMSGAKYSSNYYPFLISENGKIISNVAGNLLRSIRPVISLSKNVNVTGSGTYENPYSIQINN